tara:strand:- start:591 stop:1046 length:456 start_codon:yes stop_codon:yes gene_type:complete
MAYFKPKRNRQGFTEERKLPSVPEGSPIGTASIYDAFVRSLWERTLDEYDRRQIGWPNEMGEGGIPYPGKEEWWDDPRSRLPLLHEFNKYYPEEVLKRESLLKEEADIMEQKFERLQTPRRQWLFDAKRKARKEDEKEYWRRYFSEGDVRA